MENRTENVSLSDLGSVLLWSTVLTIWPATLIDPPRPLTYSEEHVPLMSSEEVSEVLEEVAPIAMGGKQINESITFSGCNQFRLTDYENISIMRSTHTCDPSSHDQDIRTTITFKRDICPKQNK